VPVRGLTNRRRYERFSDWVDSHLAARPADRVVGFNKMPGLDVYFAADPCFEAKARTQRGPLYRLSGRYRHFAAYERAVFDRQRGWKS
jgi:UDP-glucose:(heptosyl)LPS alpha-1,3-glucosyltransferase